MAGAKAAEAVAPGMILGLGTGSTVAFFLASLAERFREGEIPGIVGVPTSAWTQRRSEELGIPLVTLQEARALDLTVDGADEVDPQLDLIKGLGGALLREKMVAQATRHMVIIVDEGKMVERLGMRSPLPVEVVPFSWESHLSFLESLGAQPALRSGEDGTPYLTDNGNPILDCRFPEGIPDPMGLQEALAARAGVVESGLFLGMAGEVLVGTEGGVDRITRTG
ncbi:MAG: ribose 5-phosphate isomerase A, partial [Gemmatimonadetes bacterium]|nr:ribose 5-phosphate isomerase A [Gemmatimonadota bacterium]